MAPSTRSIRVFIGAALLSAAAALPMAHSTATAIPIPTVPQPWDHHKPTHPYPSANPSSMVFPTAEPTVFTPEPSVAPLTGEVGFPAPSMEPIVTPPAGKIMPSEEPILNETLPSDMPVDSNPEPTPAPNAGEVVPTDEPVYFSPEPMPEYASPEPMPEYASPEPMPEYDSPKPTTIYGYPKPTPIYGYPEPTPTYGSPEPASTYGSPEPTPNGPIYGHPSPAPSSYPTSYPSPAPSQPAVHDPLAKCHIRNVDIHKGTAERCCNVRYPCGSPQCKGSRACENPDMCYCRRSVCRTVYIHYSYEKELSGDCAHQLIEL